MIEPQFTDSPRLIEGRPEGMLEYETRQSIRDLVRLYGFEEARELVAGILNDECERRRS